MNKIREIIRLQEGFDTLMEACQISKDRKPHNPWVLRSVKYLAKNIALNPLVSFWRLRDYALYK